MKRFLTLLYLVLLPFSAGAQFVSLGDDPGLHYLFGELPSYLVGGFFSHPAIRFQELGMTGADKFYVGFTARLGLEQW